MRSSAVLPGILVTGILAFATLTTCLAQAPSTLLIKGAADLRSALLDALDDASWAAACQFTLDFDPMFTQRESELLARYAQEHRGLPAGNDLDDDLF